MNLVRYEVRVSESDASVLKIERITVLQEDIVEGASVPTWLVRYPSGRTARVAKDSFSPSAVEAWLSYRRDLVAGIKSQEKDIQRSIHLIREWSQQVGMVDSKIDQARNHDTS